MGVPYKLYKKDCFDVFPTLSGIDAVITDPPYLYQNKMGGQGIERTTKYDDGLIDDMSDFDPSLFLEETKKIMQTYNLVSFCSRDQVPLYVKFAFENDYIFDLHFWHKLDSPPFINGTFKSDIEYIVLIYEKGRTFNKGFRQSHYSKVYSSATEKTKVNHPTVKPLALMKKYVSILVPQNGVVLDPFMGSGTTGVAALQLGCQFIGIERNVQRFAVAKSRIGQSELQPALLPRNPTKRAPDAGKAAAQKGLFE